MLESLRNASKSWIAKVLFALLILSFAAWGVGDVVRMSFQGGPAIEVGSEEISAQEVAREFQGELRRAQAMFGDQLTVEQAKQFGLLDQTIRRMVNGELLDVEARSLGLAATDEAVRRRVAGYAAFKNQMGQFDPYLYRQALSSAGLTEDQFVRMERENVLRALLSNTVGGEAAVPDALLMPLVRFRQERRVAETLVFEAAKMPAPALPAEGVLADYHKTHAERFMAPEYRKVTALVLTPADAARDVQVTDQMIEEAYNQRVDEFTDTERRQVEQVLLLDEAAAQRAGEAVKAGRDLAAIAKEAGTTVTDLGTLTKADLPPEVADAVFAQAPKTVGQPVQSPLGWHVFRIVKAEGGQKKSLAEVKDKIRADILHEKGLDRIFELSNQVQDQLAGGAALEEVAKKLDLKLTRVEIDATGRDRAGQPAKALPEGQAFLKTAFQTAPAADSDVVEIEGDRGFFVLHVDEVIPAALRPFDEVKKQVADAWTADQKAQAAKEAAQAAAEKLKAGASLADAAGGRARVETTQPFTRDQAGAVPPTVLPALFEGQPGTVAVGQAQGGTIVARLKSVQPFDPAAGAGAVAAAREQVVEQMADDLITVYLAGLTGKHAVEIDRAVIENQLR